MTPEDREKRIEAAMIERFRDRFASNARERVEAILDAADRAVPIVSRAYARGYEQMCHEAVLDATIAVDEAERAERRAVKAEAVARDLADALRELYEEVEMGEAVGTCLPNRAPALRARNLLAAHPFAGKPADARQAECPMAENQARTADAPSSSS